MNPEILSALIGFGGASILWGIGIGAKVYIVSKNGNGKVTKDDIRAIVDPKFEVVFKKFDNLKCTDHAEKIAFLQAKTGIER